MSRRRVVVTGLGIVSPLGSTVATAWDGIVNGRSGVGPITRMDVSAFPVRIGGQVQGFNAEDYLSPKDVRKFDPFVPFGVASAVAGDQGLRLRSHRGQLRRASAWRWARGIGGLSTIEDNTAKWLESKIAAQDLAVLHPGQHHQRDRRAGLDPVRAARTEHRAGHGVHDVDAFDRPGRPPDPVRRCRHHGGGRGRDGVHAARRRQLLPGAGAVAAQ